MLAVSLFAVALAIALLVTATWGLDHARAHRIAERRRANAFRLAELAAAEVVRQRDTAAETIGHQRAIAAEAIRQLRDAYAREPALRLYTIPAHCRDLHDEN